MKRLLTFLLFGLLVLFVYHRAAAFTINGQAPGGTVLYTPIAVGTTTPVPVLVCNTSQSPTTITTYVDFHVFGGTSGTDGCVFAPAPTSSPCAAATPAPVSASKSGVWVGTGADFAFNWPSAGGGTILSSEWDAVCTAGSMTVSAYRFP